MFVISLETVNTLKVLLFRTLGQIKKKRRQDIMTSQNILYFSNLHII